MGRGVWRLQRYTDSYMSKYHKKTKQLLFGRSPIFIGLLLFQILLLLLAFLLFNTYLQYMYGSSLVISLLLTIHIVNRRQNPAFKLAWIIPLQIVPIFGVVLFFFITLQPGSRKVAKKLEHIEAETSHLNLQEASVMEYLQKHHPAVSNLASYNKNCCGLPISSVEELTYFPLGEDMWKQLLIDLSEAKSFIFLEYFIVEDGQMLSSIETVLAERVAAGVEVRFLYDGVGSISTLPQDYPKQLGELGIDCRVFTKPKPLLSTVQNNRDHRKIAVIDGKTAYTGGNNIADEYVNLKTKYGHWKDTSLRVTGQAVDGFTTLFLQLWHAGENNPLYWPYLRHNEFSLTDGNNGAPNIMETDLSCIGNEDSKATKSIIEEAACIGSGSTNLCKGFVMPYGDNPYDNQTIARYIYLDILYTAVNYVHIMSPYLIIDHELCVALKYAAERGVSVVMILPHIPDKAYAYYLARSYYGELIDSGVQIYEYTPGFVHAKVFVSDDKKAVVGTSNLDFRSLFLHFECGAYIFDHPVVEDMEKDFMITLLSCQQITKKECRRFPLHKKIAGKVLRLFAPLM